MERLGKQTIKFNTPPTILDCASIVGPKESEGPLAKYFDKGLDDEFWGEKTWEKAESKIVKETSNAAINKAGLSGEQIDYCFSGDLLNGLSCLSPLKLGADLPAYRRKLLRTKLLSGSG